MEQDSDIREFGPQPLGDILTAKGFQNHDLVASSTEQLTHKMVAKAVRGRFVSSKIRLKILHALNKASGEEYTLQQLFNYR